MIEIRVPTSKSVTQRALVLAALTPGASRVLEPLRCDDSQVLLSALERFGVYVSRGDRSLSLHGEGQLRAPPEPLHLGNAGTAMRFCAALTLLADGPVTLDGDPAMRRRPMAGLLRALQRCGARVQEHGRPGCPPLTLTPPADPGAVPAEVSLDPSGSSQQLSALLLVAPRLARGLRVRLTGTLPSRPYVDLTLAILRDFGATAQALGATDPRVDAGGPVDRVPTGREPGAPSDSLGGAAASPRIYHVARGGLHARDYRVEGDHSSASYPLAAGFLTNHPVQVTNVRPDSPQGDRVFPVLLDRLDAPGPRTFDLSDTPDIAPTVATCALFSTGQTTLVGLAHLRIKESDRLAVLTRAFRQVGADVQEHDDGLVIHPRPLHGHVTLDPAHDHRMAMCFGLLGLRLPDIQISDRQCVTKSYPGYFEMLERFIRR
jgi:3-phosphoshikimate 1-carboxyvinyltransferase